MLEYVLSALNDAVLAYDVHDKKYLFISPAVEQVLGYKADDFNHQPELWNNIIDPRDKIHITEAAKKLNSPGEQELTYRIITPERKIKWVQDKQVVFIHKDTHQKVFLNIIKDVTEIKNYKEDTEQRVWFLNSLVDAQGALIFRVNVSGRYTYFNDSYAQALGYEVNELTGKSIDFITIPEDVPILEATFQNCINHPGEIFHVSHRKIARNGSIHCMESDCVGVMNRFGNLEEIQGVGLDMTKQIEAQQKTQDLLNKLNFYVDSITDLFLILNKDWNFVRVNKAFEKLSRKDRKELLGKCVWDVFPTLRGTIFETSSRKAMQEKVSLTFTEYFKGRHIWLRTTVYPSPEGLTVFVKDITTEKIAQEKILWTKHNLEALINNTKDLIWSVDRSKKYIFANTAYKNWVNLMQSAEQVKLLFADHNHTAYPDNHTTDWDNFYNKALNGQPLLTRREYKNPQNGHSMSFEIYFNPIVNQDGQVTGVGCFAHNITKRLKAEKAILHQNSRLRKIASLSSHELRRPVATLMGLINVLDMENMSNPENLQIIAHIHNTSQELDNVIRLIVNKTFIDANLGEAD